MMRVSTLFKNVFSEPPQPIKVVSKKELNRMVKTKTVLIDPKVIAKLFQFFISRGNIEGVSILRGQISGEYLLVMDTLNCDASMGTFTNAVAGTKYFSEASEIDDGNYVVGLAHSHVGKIPVFMSGTDQTTQQDFQSIFPDAVSLVMNPFTAEGISFKFYRFDGGTIKELTYGYLRDEDEESV